ncbi:alpha/beta fold hydrolase [Dongia sp.]|uniref:alpha/beta fold hydrolase n=1 Tax=Dongia sp. TaxID=1977262 RepID=UPI0035B0AC23
MPIADLGDLSLWYQRYESDASDAVPALLIQGLGMQATDWPQTLIDRLLAKRPVIVFDNRDAGLSQCMGASSIATLAEADFPDERPLPGHVAYTLGDMAEDARRLLDHLGVGRAHLIGFSMGGMIAQLMAAIHPAHACSVTGLMTSAGQAWIRSSPDADQMMRRSIVAETDRTQLVEQYLVAEEIYAGPSTLPSLTERRESIGQALARGYHPAGIWRQARAMRAGGARQELLAGLSVPILMLHGSADPVINVSQAAEIRNLLPQAWFEILPGTGHVLTEANGSGIAARIAAFWDSLS